MRDNLVDVWGTRSPHIPPAPDRAHTQAHVHMGRHNVEQWRCKIMGGNAGNSWRKRLSGWKLVSAGQLIAERSGKDCSYLYRCLRPNEALWVMFPSVSEQQNRSWPSTLTYKSVKWESSSWDWMQDVRKPIQNRAQTVQSHFFYFIISRKGLQHSESRCDVFIGLTLPPWGVRDRPTFPVFHHARACLVMAGVLRRLAAWSQKHVASNVTGFYPPLTSSKTGVQKASRMTV